MSNRNTCLMKKLDIVNIKQLESKERYEISIYRICTHWFLILGARDGKL